MPILLSHGGRTEATVRQRLIASASVTPDFDYMFKKLVTDSEAHLPQGLQTPDVVQCLSELADAMVEESISSVENSTIPPIYTYWGQFISHEVTALANNMDGASMEQAILQLAEDFQTWNPEFIRCTLVNLLNPRLDLDSIYDEGPEQDLLGIYEDDHVRLKLGANTDSGPALTPYPQLGMKRDVPRYSSENATAEFPERAPRIGDRRNDDNLIVSQLHTAMLHFHNAVVEWVAQQEQLEGAELLRRAQELTRWHFQWLVVEDYLRMITFDGTVDTVLESSQVLGSGQLYMPLEFSAAAFRFGHSMVRSAYDYNQNFGHPKSPATLDQLFNLTGRGGLSATGVPNSTLPSDWIIDWDRFVRADIQWPDRFARKIDINIVPPMARLTNEWKDAVYRRFDEYEKSVFKHIAKRNLLRGYLLHVPIGQAVAAAIGIQPLSPAQIQCQAGEHTRDILQRGGFLEKTPLWYYILKEAEVEACGNSLGRVGSYIVAHTLIGVLKADSSSYLHAKWNPAQGVRLPNRSEIRTIIDLFRFAGVAV